MAVYSPLNDPAYQAYRAESEYLKQDRHHRMWESIGSLQRRWQSAQPGYADQTRNAQENVANDFESRGFYSGGERVRQQVLAASDIENRRREQEQAYYEQVYGEQSDAYRDMAQIGMEQAMQEYQARARQELFEYNRLYGG